MKEGRIPYRKSLKTAINFSTQHKYELACLADLPHFIVQIGLYIVA